MKSVIALLTLLVLASICAAQSVNSPAPTDTHRAEIGEPCVFDFERGELPDCVRENTTGQLSIAVQYLSELPFDAQGLATVLSHDKGWMYVNRKGKVLISGVVRMENGPDSFHNGLVRFVRNKKYGFANRKGQIVIPPIYDGAMNFESGVAKVCKGCQEKCAEAECEHHSFDGGEWSFVDPRGHRVK
jgi:hypothetical protein